MTKAPRLTANVHSTHAPPPKADRSRIDLPRERKKPQACRPHRSAASSPAAFQPPSRFTGRPGTRPRPNQPDAGRLLCLSLTPRSPCLLSAGEGDASPHANPLDAPRRPKGGSDSVGRMRRSRSTDCHASGERRSSARCARSQNFKDSVWQGTPTTQARPGVPSIRSQRTPVRKPSFVRRQVFPKRGEDGQRDSAAGSSGSSDRTLEPASVESALLLPRGSMQFQIRSSQIRPGQIQSG